VDNPLNVESLIIGGGGMGDFCFTFYFEGKWGVKVGDVLKKM